MRKRSLLSLFTALLAVLFVFAGVTTTEAAAKIALNKKTIKVTQQQECTLKLKGVKKKNVKWSSSDKTIATVKKGVVKGKKVGKCVITAKYAGKKYKCKVAVVTNNPKKYSGDVKISNGYSGFGYKTGVTVLRSRKEVEAYQETLKSKKAYKSAGTEEKKFFNLLNRYNAAYFKAHSLIIVSKYESSGSYQVEYGGIASKDGSYTLGIVRKVPAADVHVTHNTENWRILIETDNKEITNDNIKLQVETIQR